MKIPPIGDEIEDFTLSDQNGNENKLSELKGKKVLLSFHPLAWTGVCAKQMQSLEANHHGFEELNTIAFGINVDSVPSKKAWADDLGITNTSLLSDFWPHGKVADDLGIFLEDEGFSGRVNVIIDEEGLIKLIKVYEIPELPDINEILDVLKGM
ncbi:MAG: redoxin domain-containing protein [Thermoplasmata archaeon]|nr:redoxin domain-containing protein [Thermoplasmata archaeon]